MARKWEKALKESSYVCNQAAGYNRCLEALEDLRDMLAFNQNVSFAMGKAMQHLSDTLFLQMANMSLLQHDTYLDHIKLEIKLSMKPLRPSVILLSRLKPCFLMRCSGVLRMRLLNSKHDASHTSQPGSGAGRFRGILQTKVQTKHQQNAITNNTINH